MKKLIGFGLLLVACHSASTAKPTPTTSGTGAASARDAVTAFLAAAKAGDLQAMSAVWGTANGSIRKDMPRDTIEMRETYLFRCLRHDRYTMISEASGAAGTRVVAVQISYGSLTRVTDFTEVADPTGRWYVQSFQIEKVSDICSAR